jgi:hypothetical protein
MVTSGLLERKGRRSTRRRWPIIEDQSPCTALDLLQGTMALLFSY